MRASALPTTPVALVAPEPTAAAISAAVAQGLMRQASNTGAGSDSSGSSNSSTRAARRKLTCMQELRTAFRTSIFLKAEASTFLSSNYKYFESDYINASYYSRLIFRDYPGNIIYRINCIEDLLLIQKYDEARKLILSASPDNRYYQGQIMILNAILAEKNENLHQAEKDYRNGIEIISEFRNYGDQYKAYAYFGLSRISASRNDSHNQRVFRRRALDLTDFDHVNFN
jgi:hypothetical protein